MAACPGCAWQQDERPGPVRTPPGGALVASPFSPASIRVYPLTHFEVGERGEAIILVFLELKDQWGDTVKGAGTLGVHLSRPEGGAANRETQASEWSIDLTNLERNAKLYDPSTRTYRVALKGLPAWCAAMARGEAGGPGWVVLEAYFKTVGPDGSAVTLRDRFDLRRGG